MNGDSSSPSAPEASDDSIDSSSEVTWGQATRVWWSFMWRVALFSAMGMWVVWFTASVLAKPLGVDLLKSIPPAYVLFLVPIPVEIWAMRTILSMSWSGFRTEVVPSGEGYLQSRLRMRRPPSST